MVQRAGLAEREELRRRAGDRLLYVDDLLRLEHGAVLDRRVRDELSVG